ncbi:unnamed protein product [Soboliphyme baturini]|uniref:Uncharacterized protein n=1 Tax=Soboliphyme baturini TaxID=241478 RepID=A0A183IJD9_9BILA|nr:unnamed protein product [Soboliphyme baturini]
MVVRLRQKSGTHSGSGTHRRAVLSNVTEIPHTKNGVDHHRVSDTTVTRRVVWRRVVLSVHFDAVARSGVGPVCDCDGADWSVAAAAAGDVPNWCLGGFSDDADADVAVQPTLVVKRVGRMGHEDDCSAWPAPPRNFRQALVTVRRNVQTKDVTPATCTLCERVISAGS